MFPVFCTPDQETGAKINAFGLLAIFFHCINSADLRNFLLLHGDVKYSTAYLFLEKLLTCIIKESFDKALALLNR